MVHGEACVRLPVSERRGGRIFGGAGEIRMGRYPIDGKRRFKSGTMPSLLFLVPVSRYKYRLNPIRHRVCYCIINCL